MPKDLEEYKQLSEKELLKRAKADDKLALKVLIERYQPLLLSLSNKYFIKGLEKDDLIQEASIALIKAIKSYDFNADIDFSAYAKLITERHIIDKLRAASNINHKAINEAVTINQDNRDIISYLAQKDEAAPEKSQEFKFSQELLEEEDFQARFSKLEWAVLLRRLRGLTYQEIADDLNRSYKSVDNALQRIKNKLQEYKEKK